MAAGDVSVNINNPKTKKGTSFDGVDDYVETSYDKDLEEYTYTMWIKPTCNGDAAQSIFSGYSTSYWNNGVWIYASLKYIRARRRRETTNSEAYIASAVIKPNEWQHIAVVMTADKYLKIYLNGVEGTYDTQTQGAGDVVEYGQDYLIGGLTVSGSNFQGNISNVQVYNRALTDEEITKVYSGLPVENGLISQWKLSEDYKDSVGNNDGTNHGSTLITTDEQTEKASDLKYCSFDGVDDYVRIEGTAANGSKPIGLNESFTISALLNFSESKSCYLINNYEGTSPFLGQSILIHADPSSGKIILKGHIDDNINPVTIESPELLELGKWYNMMLIRDKGNTLKLYVDGVEKVSAADITTGDIISNRDWFFGRRAQSSGEQFNGYMANVQMWDRALTDEEITKVYSGLPVENGLIHQWELKDDYSDSIKGIDGTNYGTTLYNKSSVSNDLKNVRTTANDKYLMAVVNDKIVTAVVEET